MRKLSNFKKNLDLAKEGANAKDNIAPANGPSVFEKISAVIKTLFSTAWKKYPGFFFFEALKTIIQAGIPFVGLILTPMIVDEIVGQRDIKRLTTLAAILVISEFVLEMLNQWTMNRLERYNERLSNHFTMEIGKHSMKLDFQLTEDKQALDQLDRAKTGMTWYSGGVYGVAEQVFMFAGNVFKIAGFMTLIIMHAPWMLLFIFLYTVANAIISSKINKVAFEAYGRLSLVNRLFGYFAWTVVDFKYGKDIRLYNAKDMFVNRWADYTETTNEAWSWQGDMSYKYNRYSTLSMTFFNVALYLYSGFLVILSKISIGIFTQILSATNAFNATLNGLVWNIQEIVKRSNYAYEYVKFMEYPEAIEKNHDKVEEGLHVIEFRDVSFAYPGTEKLILDHINITITPGEKLSIVGLNGAGKTTFIKLLCRLYDPTEGEILMDGKNIKDYDYAEYMKQFAPVFQDFKLLGFPISENVMLKAKENRSEEEEERVKKLLKLVELEHLCEKNKNGIDTLVYTIFDDDGIEPSGGEQQKLAIARALYKNAPVIILDEPTAALDPVAEYEIYRQFHTLVGDKTAFYISHRLSSCKFCDKIAVFSEGTIAEYGNHDSLVTIENGIYRKMFEAQAQYYR